MKYKAISVFSVMSLTIVLSLSVTGCWTTVKDNHPLVVKNAAGPHAKVYFIRPRTERFMGMADNRIKILLDNVPLMDLVKNEYTLVDIEPGFRLITAENQTTYGPAHKIKTEKRSSGFTFLAGNTYYVLINPIDGEFRGVIFIPNLIDLKNASRLARNLRAVGQARGNAIPDLATQ